MQRNRVQSNVATEMRCIAVAGKAWSEYACTNTFGDPDRLRVGQFAVDMQDIGAMQLDIPLHRSA